MSFIPAETDSRLRRLLSTKLAEYLPGWRAAAAAQRPSLPRLEDHDWRVDVHTTSGSAARVGVPSVLLNMRVRGTPQRRDELAPTSDVTMELNQGA